jgi:uncharacterized protein YcnI
MKRTLTALAAAALVVLIAAPALAHVTVSPGAAPADSFATLTFQVPHGCEGSSTTSLAIQIPAGVVSVKPQPKPGWEITIEEGTLPEPVDYFGETITEGVLSVTWTGGPLEDRFMDLFGLSVKLPAGEGETLYFPAVQTCEEGETAWIQIPAEGQTEDELEEPAPALVLTAGGGDGSEGEEGDGMTSGEGADDASTVPMATAALVAGGLGLISGGAALVMARRRG